MAWAGATTFPGPDTFPGFAPGSYTPGPADAHSLIVILDGVPVDLSADITGSVTVAQQRRASETEQPQPATMAVTLANRSGRYTPDNPGSDIAPGIRLGSPIAYAVIKDGTTTLLFQGRVDGITPSWSTSVTDGTVAITASDRLAEAAGQTLRSDACERWVQLAEDAGGTSDVWMFGEEDGASSYANSGRAGLGRAAVAVPAKNGRGQVALGQAEGLTVEGQVTVTDSGGFGPVVVASHATGQKCMLIWFRWDGPPPYLPDYSMLMSGRVGRVAGDDDGLPLWYLRFAESAVGSNVFRLELRNAANALVAVLDNGQGDGAWHSLYIANSTPGRTTFSYDRSTVRASATFDLTDQSHVVCGGAMNPYVKGAQTRCMAASFAALMVSTAAGIGGLEEYAKAGATSTATQRFGDLMAWATYGGSYSMVGEDARPVAVKSVLGRAQLDCLTELATTIAGTVWHDPATDQVQLLTGPAWRPQDVTATVVVELDDDIDGGHEWDLSLTDSPTRVTVSCPAGEATYVDAVAEQLGRRPGDAVETCAATIEDARSLAAWQVGRIRRLSLTRFAVDVASAVNSVSLWPALLGLRPGGRLHIIGLDRAVWGITTTDVHVLGWEVEIGPERARWVFDCFPADSPAEYAVEDAVYGRIGWDDGEATASALSTSGTSLTITTGWPLTTDPDEYPLHLLVDSEVLEVPAPPVSSTSPQTVTVVRAALGTTPVAHPAGRSVFLFPDVRVGP